MNSAGAYARWVMRAEPLLKAARLLADLKVRPTGGGLLHLSRNALLRFGSPAELLS